MNLRWNWYSVILVLVYGCWPHSDMNSRGELSSQSSFEAQVPMQFLVPYRIEITGQNYRWRIRYPGLDGLLHTTDDVFDEGDLHLPVQTEVVLELRSEDYVYLLSFPQFHLKEIAVPTLEFRLPLRSNSTGEYEFEGEEFCGDPHPELKRRLLVQPLPEFEAWIRQHQLTQPKDVAKL